MLSTKNVNTRQTLSQWVLLIPCLLLAYQPLAEALRGGAPALACRSLRPFHGFHRPKPASASQFFLTQSSLSYGPNESVTVEISTHSNERFFKGFLIQAYDPSNGKRFGQFLPTELSQPVYCSAATHRNHDDKRHVTLKWVESTGFDHFGGPANNSTTDETQQAGRRQVRFKGTVVVTYSEFYTGFESSELNFAKWDFSNGL